MRRTDGLGFGRSALTKVDRENHHRADGEELGLPVLEGLLPEIGVEEIAAPGDAARASCVACSALKTRQLLRDWPNQVAKKMSVITISSEFS